MAQAIATVTFLVRAYDEAITWFTEVLGFALVADTPLPDGKRWVVMAPAGAGMRLLLAEAATPEQAARIGDQTGGRVFLFLETDDFARDHAAMAEALGMAICSGAKGPLLGKTKGGESPEAGASLPDSNSPRGAGSPAC